MGTIQGIKVLTFPHHFNGESITIECFTTHSLKMIPEF